MAATAIIPVKRLGSAKQRLAAGLSGEQRRRLMAAMFRDTADAVRESRQLDRVIVVSGDSEIDKLARAAGFQLLTDPPDAGHSGAALLAIEHLAATATADRTTGAGRHAAGGGAAETVILLPSDCPLLDPRQIDHLLTGLPERFVTIVPDRHGYGTNALVLRPPDAIAPSFGEGSRARHEEAARAAGVPYAIEQLSSLGLDLDTPADLVALARELPGQRRGRHTAKVLRL